MIFGSCAIVVWTTANSIALSRDGLIGRGCGEMLLIEFVGDDVFMVFMVALALLLFIRFRDVLMLLCMLLSAVCGRAIGIPSKPWWYLMCDEMWSSVRCGETWWDVMRIEK